MTENLLQKLEEKMMLLVSEIEQARKEIERLAKENATLSAEKEKNSGKLHELLSLLDAVDTVDHPILNTDNNLSSTRPVLLTKETLIG